MVVVGAAFIAAAGGMVTAVAKVGAETGFCAGPRVSLLMAGRVL